MSSANSANFSARLDDETDERFSALVRDAGETLGKLPSYRGRRHPERVDLLRAFLVIAEHDPAVRSAVIAQVRTDRLQRYGTAEPGADDAQGGVQP